MDTRNALKIDAYVSLWILITASHVHTHTPTKICAQSYACRFLYEAFDVEMFVNLALPWTFF